MRNLIILRGSPASGKSTWVKKNKLEKYTLSADEIRMLVQSPIMGLKKNSYEISQKNDKLVWTILYELLEERMKKGELIIVDATHSKSSDFSKYNSYCEKYRYRKYYVDFTDVPIEECKRRNAKREVYKRVPEEVIDKMYSRFVSQGKTSGWVELDKEHFKDQIAMKPIDMDKYTRIHIFGDIHGSFVPLDQYFKMNKFSENEFYIFCGDYLDRGIENKEVLEYLMELSKNKNVLFLEGNHEKWLRFYGNDEIEEIKSKTFKNKTIPEIVDIDKADIRAFCRKIGQLAYFTFKGNTYLVTHGGLSYMPKDLSFIATDTIINGVGDYGVDIDKIWSDNAKTELEVWKPIKDYEGYYEISNYGRVRSCERDIITKDGVKQHFKSKILSQSLNVKGYPKVIITKNSKQKIVYPHRIVAETFIPNPSNLPQVNHIDENKTNNFVENLEWCTNEYNSNYGTRNSRMAEHHRKDCEFDKIPDYKKIKPSDCFSDNIGKPVIQVHCHRNSFDLDFPQMEYSYNLEGKVEFGGFLRVLRIDNKINMIQMKNPFVAKDEFEESRPVKDGQVDSGVPIIDKLRASKYIRETDLGNNISSFNFTRDAFFNKKWNSLTTSARGLFMNTETNEVVARGYNKFFNINERRDTDLLHLSTKFKDKITCYTKYNGFLGIMSYVNGELFLASKSTNQGDYAGYFKTIFENSNIKKDFLIDYLKENNVSLTFEVIDPINDPHIIKYDEPRIVLLDIIDNSLEFNKRPYEEVVELGRNINCEYKLIYKEFENYRDFFSWYNVMSDEENLAEELEGVVIECCGIMTKFKFPYYNFWKQMRAVKETLARGRKPKFSSLYTAKHNDLYNWFITLDMETLQEKSIIQLRDIYEIGE